MLPVWWLLMFTILIIEDVTGASVAEEINFEVSNMRESVKKDTQVPELDKDDYDQEDSNSRSESDDPELAPSEIVETHVLPEELPQEDANTQMKRPRRRRRRRRRKRPKPTAIPEDVGTYYSAPEEESMRKPIKYRLPDTNYEATQETSTPPRRRNVKRRRRPQKRPTLDESIPTAEEIPEQTNSTADELQTRTNNNQQTESQDKYNLRDSPDQIILYPSEIQKPEPEHSVDQFVLDIDRPAVSDNEAKKPLKEEIHFHDYVFNHDQQDHSTGSTTQEYLSAKTLTSSENPKMYANDDHLNRAPNTAFVFSKLVTQEEETTITPKRRKRPSLKVKNITETDVEKHENESLNTETRNHNSNHRKSDGKFNSTGNLRSKIEDNVKIREPGRKEGFKIRRLPPTSAILRQVKIRPLKKNETQSKIEEHFNNEIISLNESASPSLESRDPPRSSHNLQVNISNHEEDNTHSPSEKILAKEEENFESLIIKHTTQSTLKNTSLPSPSPSTTSTTTENTAFIYIPCNHTLNGVLKQKFNFTDNNVTSTNKFHKHSNKPLDLDPIALQNSSARDESADVFKSVAMEELEKLLQHVKSEAPSTTSSTTGMPKYTSISRNNTQHYDENAHSNESELSHNYRFHNTSPKTRTFQPATEVSDNQNREPKWYQEYTKVQRDSKERKYENAFVKPSPADKELVLLYTSTSNPSLIYNDVDSDEFSLHIRNNTFPRKYYQESLVHRSKNHAERKKLPLAVKSAIIISGAILALAVLGFFALLLSCKIRQAKSRMKCHRELYRENFHNSEFRQSSRSTSPVVSKSNYNGRSFVNNMQPNIASNRNYYLWQTLRKTFQYD